MRLHDREVVLRPGIGVWARPGGLYLATHDPSRPLGVSAVHFDLLDRETGKRVADSDLPDEVFDLVDVNYVDAVLSRIVELSAEASRRSAGNRNAGRIQQAAARLMHGLLADVTATQLAMSSLPGSERRWVTVVHEFAQAMRTDPHVPRSVASLARQAKCSPDHLTRMFRKVTGTSPSRFVVEARIDRARQLLTETDLNVSQIATALGYSNVYFFSRQFSQEAGASPTQYRQSILGHRSSNRL